MLVRTTDFGPIANLFHSRVSRADKLGSGDRTWTDIARRRRRDRCSGWCANFGSGAERPANGFRPGGGDHPYRGRFCLNYRLSREREAESDTGTA